MLLWWIRISLLIKCTASFSDEEFDWVVDFHTNVCGFPNMCTLNSSARETKDTLSVEIINQDIMSCCQPCSCDMDECVLRDTCCLTDKLVLPGSDKSDHRPKQTCEPLTFQANRTQGYKGVWMFSACPNVANVSDIYFLKCEKSYSFNTADIYVPVFDGHFVYKNRYCAMCNGVQETDVRYFDIYINCNTGLIIPLFLNSTFSDFQDPNCNIIYSVPVTINDTLWGTMSMKDHVCYTNTDVVSVCNATGNWLTFDPLIEAACDSYTTVFESYTAVKYKNVFCYLCNSNLSSEHDILCVSGRGTAYNRDIVLPPPLTRLLNFFPDGRQKDTDKSCNPNQVLDKRTKQCLYISCPSEMVYLNGTCVHKHDIVERGKYNVFIALTLNEIYTNDSVLSGEEFVEEMLTANRSLLNAVGRTVYSDFLDVLYEMFHMINTYVLNTYLLKAIVDYHEDPLFVIYWEFYIKPHIENDFSTVKQVLAIDNSTFNVSFYGYLLVFLCKLEKFKIDSSNYNTIKSFDRPVEYYLIRGMNPGNSLMNYIKMIEGNVLLPTYACPLVEVPYTYEVETFTGDVLVLNRGVNIPKSKYIINPEDGGLQVCLDIFNQLNGEYVFNEQASNNVFVLQILSLICSSASVMCAILTFTAYCLFKELRTQPGVNNMCLCVSLMSAQLLDFIVGYHQEFSGLTCQILGVFIHFAWLNMVLWLNVCSIHMYRAFNSMFTPSTSFSGRLSSHYILYTVTLSSAPVLVNIILHVSTDLGYSTDTCYISRPHMIGYTFAAPVALLIAINIGPFLRVVYILSNRPTIQTSNKAAKNFLKIYAKLSTVTGMTWIFGFVYQFAKVNIFQYVFIILNSSQGVFLFLAFIVNKRVKRLCIHECHRQRSRLSKRTRTVVNEREMETTLQSESLYTTKHVEETIDTTTFNENA